MSEEAQAPATESTGTEQATVIDGATGETVSTTTYANGKFESISALENSYAELQSSYSQKLGGFDGAPSEYTLGEDTSATGVTNAIMDWGLSNQLNNDGFNSLNDAINKANSAEMEAFKSLEVEKLGKDASTRIANATDWVKANLGEDAVEGINSMWVGAQGIETIEKMMKLSQGTSPAATPAAKSMDADQLKAMRFAKDEFGNRRMSSDPAYRAKVLELEARGGSSAYVVDN